MGGIVRMGIEFVGVISESELAVANALGSFYDGDVGVSTLVAEQKATRRTTQARAPTAIPAGPGLRGAAGEDHDPVPRRRRPVGTRMGACRVADGDVVESASVVEVVRRREAEEFARDVAHRPSLVRVTPQSASNGRLSSPSKLAPPLEPSRSPRICRFSISRFVSSTARRPVRFGNGRRANPRDLTSRSPPLPGRWTRKRAHWCRAPHRRGECDRVPPDRLVAGPARGRPARSWRRSRLPVASGRLTIPVVVVLEGKARDGVPAGAANEVTILHAAGSGDDALIDAAAQGSGQVTLVTAPSPRCDSEPKPWGPW